MKSRILTRFELFCNGESQRIGFIRGLDETGIPNDIRSTLVYNFDKELSLPPKEIFNVELREGEYIASYFTEKGIEKFRKDINNIVYAVCKEQHYTVGRIVTTIDPENVLYQDEYQIIQISRDLTDISSAVIESVNEDGYYRIHPNPKDSLITVSLNKIESSDCVVYNIIVNPFYLEGEMIYYINTERKIIKVSSEKIY